MSDADSEAIASHWISTEAELRSVYPKAVKTIREKAIGYLDDFALKYIRLSPFFCIGTADPADLADVSPRGGTPGFVHALNDKQVAFPDRPGNNRLDTLTNILHARSVGLLFFIPGIEETLRINGTARISIQPDLIKRFVVDDKRPRSVIVIDVVEVYLHCSKALKRSGLWDPAIQVQRSVLPTWGEMLRNQKRSYIPAGLVDFVIRLDAKKNLY